MFAAIFEEEHIAREVLVRMLRRKAQDLEPQKEPQKKIWELGKKYECQKDFPDN